MTKRLSPEIAALCAVLVCAAVLRYWGLDFGLPHPQCRPDETLLTGILMRWHRWFRPEHYWYPSLYMYALLPLFAAYYAVGFLAGAFQSPAAFLSTYAMNPAPFLLLSRFLSATLGWMSVFVIWRLVSEAWGRKYRLASAFFLAFSYLHVRNSHFGTTDVAMLFLLLCSLLFIVRYHRGARQGAAGAIFAGLATSTKYNAMLLIASHVLASLVRGDSLRRSSTWRRAAASTGLFALLMAAGFFAATPFGLAEPVKMVSDLFAELRHLSAGQCLFGERAWLFHAAFTLPLGMGRALFAAGVLGTLYCFIRNWRRALVLYSFPILFYVLSARGLTVFTRYALPVVPFLCIGAAVMCVDIADAAGRFTRTRYVGAGAAAALCAALAFEGAARSIAFDICMARTDSRVVAARWIGEHVPTTASICRIASPYGGIELPPPREDLVKKLEDERSRGQRASIPLHNLRYWERNVRHGYRQLCYDRRGRVFLDQGATTGELPEYLVVERSPLTCYTRVPDEIRELLAQSYQSVYHCDGLPLHGSQVYDAEDAFFAPYAAFAGVVRPGPTITVYRLKRSAEAGARENPL